VLARAAAADAGAALLIVNGPDVVSEFFGEDLLNMGLRVRPTGEMVLSRLGCVRSSLFFWGEGAGPARTCMPAHACFLLLCMLHTAVRKGVNSRDKHPQLTGRVPPLLLTTPKSPPLQWHPGLDVWRHTARTAHGQQAVARPPIHWGASTVSYES